MKTLVEKKYDVKKLKPGWFLVIGIITMSLSHLSFNIDILAWVSMVPFLIYLKLTKGWRSGLLFACTLIITWSLIVFKIITHPIPYIFIPLYSVPIALIHLPGYLLFSKLRNRKLIVLLFPSIMVIMEWLQYTFTPLGSWGVAAYTQTESINIAQTLSLFGLPGLSFIIYWVNSAFADVIIERKLDKFNFAIPAISLAVLLIFGYLRFDISKSKGRDNIKVAAVGTDSEVSGLPLPSEDETGKYAEKLIQRTEVSAKAGAEIVVWNEAALALNIKNEDFWVDKFSKIALKNKISIVVSYVAVIKEKPFKFENKLLIIKPDGSIGNEYLKHEPVPGEPSVKGIGKVKVVNTGNVNLGQAICYDYDFPYLAVANRKAGADIVALPSSDWRGIDPLHTRMAAFRAIEQGHSVIRSTRFGLSAAITPFGDFKVQMSSFDNNDKIMIADIPSRKVMTIYSLVGDIVVYLCILFIILFIVLNRQGKK